MKKGSHHREKSKQLMREKALAARERTKEYGYLTPEGKARRKAKIQSSMTIERKKKFAKETEQARKLAKKSQKVNADNFAFKYIPLIQEMQIEQLTFVEMAKKLNADGHTSRQGKKWTDQTVRQVLKRIQNQKEIKVRDLSSEVLRTHAKAPILSKWKPKY